MAVAKARLPVPVLAHLSPGAVPPRPVRKGEAGTTIVYADRVPEDEKQRAEETGDEPRTIPFLKRFTVFNLAHCDGASEAVAVPVPPPALNLIEPGVVVPRSELQGAGVSTFTKLVAP